MRTVSALVALFGLVFLAAPVSAVALEEGAALSAPCAGGICDTINRLCGNCLPSETSGEEACMGAVCDAINHVCQQVGGGSCVGALATDSEAVAGRCTGLPCDVVNAVCTIVRGGPCVR